MATLILSDLEFIWKQIRIAEQHAAGVDLLSLLPNELAMLGLRTVDGSYNNVVPGQQFFGAADALFPRLLDPLFRIGDTFGTYDSNGSVVDSQPRTISNLIVDQTISNPAAVSAFVDAGFGTLNANGVLIDLNGNPVPAGVTLTIPNTAPDEGLSAGFNSWFTFFGQFFDHGLDLVTKGGNGVVIVPLQPDDPLFVVGGTENFMILTRATQFNGPGADGVLGDDPATTGIDESLDDTTNEAMNTTTPFVDQNQTYTSHPSHQVFLREYALVDGRPVATGKLLDNPDNGGIPTWAQIKAQALTVLGIELSDFDVHDVPLLRTDAYGNLIPDGGTGMPQLVTGAGNDGILNTFDDIVEVGNVDNPVVPTAVGAQRTGHAFLNDIAHHASPGMIDTNNDQIPDTLQVADTDPGTADDGDPLTYDDELLNAHFVTGDGRGNENIALTAVHHVFHSEHNRQVEEIKNTLIASAITPDGLAFLNEWLATDVLAVPGDLSTLVWDGERLFQAAKFATEMQYQHLVFEEFARKVQPNVDAFLNYDATINPAIVAEFAHVVYRFGHSMLTETVDRLDPNFVSSDIGLIEAFLNPLAFDNNGALSAAEAAGSIVRGMTRQAGNEIDEFVTEALRNNLLGLPLDLPTINMTRGRDTGVPTLNEARRDFFANTSDAQLKPYESWVDLAVHLKHEASVINFIAAYGTHDALLAADVDTLADKRAVATALVLGGDAVINEGDPLTERTFTADEADRLAFLNSTGTYANLATGATTTGVDDIDLWVGGLAERQMPFGGLLGSTFNFVFETQLEALQNGDRFYYLGRLAGLNFLTEMENNSFAKLIMANTDATHLPADVFSTPTWILEVDPSAQFNPAVTAGPDGILVDDPATAEDESADNLLPNADPFGGTALLPLVIRDNPATPGADTNYLRYTGADHVVLGGTNPGNLLNPTGNDILIGSEGDDTFWGDGGNDRIEGGDGNDQIDGGAGDDIITDKGGDDVIKGGAGNDVIHAGQGLNLIIGGDGKDFIITGEDSSETFAGQGDDFILGAKTNLPTLGNEGNDWIEIGTQDGAPGDNFNLQNLDDVKGHDVLIGGGGFDELLAEGGHDVMVGSEGEDHFDGGSGFDWATYKNDRLGVTVDLKVNDFIEPPTTPSNAGILDRFAFVEGLSGSAFADILRGDDQMAADILVAGARGSVLDQEGIDLITGLQAILGAGATTFGGGNIILGGAGSDIIEGRAGNDIIDGDAWMNVRISVREANDVNGNGILDEIRSVNSMTELVSDMLAGTYNPGQLVIQREILQSAGPGFDTAVFSAALANYDIFTAADGTTVVTDNRVVGVGIPVTDGIDTLRGIERLQFADQAVVLSGINNAPGGTLSISDDTPAVNQLLTVINAVTDADGITAGSFNYLWQVERFPGTGVFTDIIQDIGGSPSLAHGTSFRVTADLDGLALRVRATYRDGDGTLENVYSDATTVVTGAVAPPAAPGTPPPETIVDSAGNGVHFIRSDLDFILQQILISEANSNAYGLDAQPLTDLLPNSRVAFGLRTVDGSFNNLIPGQTGFGASDQNFPLQLDQVFRNDLDGDTFDVNGGAPGGLITNTNYASTISVADADPRIISNLIVDQTITNPVAVNAYVAGGFGILADGTQIDPLTGLPYPVDTLLDLNEIAIPRGVTLTLPNTTPDAGLSAGFNTWFTFFGQFFDHGLDLVDKGGNGTVYIPLMPDDPLIAGADGIFGNGDDLPVEQRFMPVTRATNSSVSPGIDGVLGTSDDVHLHNNETTPFVDQNQTYTSHASHQVFLRQYVLNDAGEPVATGRLIDGVNGGIGNWAEVKAQAADLLGIQLTDADIFDVPLLLTDAYGKFIPGANGFAQFDTTTGPVEANPADNDGLGTLVPVNGLRTGHAFLNDIAHNAAPLTVFDTDGNPATPGTSVVLADDDNIAGNTIATDFMGRKVAYDDELLDAHFITGDGRGNENIGLTSVHFIFHAEHNRLAEHIKDVAVASNDLAFLNQWLTTPALALPTTPEGIDALDWNGERLFQAARFGTEMQYQHLVFEEFARKVQPQVDIFFAPTQVYDTAINPAIVAEFAHVVYRFGHSLLPDTVDRFDADFSLVGTDAAQIGLIEAFLNPLEFTASGADDVAAASAIIRGVTRQIGNEIDEFVTEAVRNNLLGLPLDLAAINLARGRDTGVPSFNDARAEFYAMTGDSQLKPYESWADLASNLKHPESIVNFIAAYGTDPSITTEATLAGKRAAATDIVLGVVGETPGQLAARLAFLNGPAETTGVNDIDLWIGGLAEKQMPFGGLLGSTFNFVFETQMEKLQDGDRFYYLER
ncbi:MAG: peroxidase family protein, partial [Burkholderiales bacterium]